MPAANAIVVNAEAGSSSDPLDWGAALPVGFYNHCTMATLTKIRRLVQRKPSTIVAVGAMTAAQVYSAASESTVSVADAVARLGQLFAAATESAELLKIKSYLDVIATMKKAGTIDGDNVVTGVYCGPLRYIYTLAIRIAEAGHAGPVLLPSSSASTSTGLDGHNVPMPTSETKFHEALNNLTMLVATLSVCSIMLLLKFINAVVFRQLQAGLPWPVVAKMFEMYLQLCDTVDTYHLGNVVETHGGMDSMERDARARLAECPVCFSGDSEQRPPGSEARRGGEGDKKVVKVKFNGRFSRDDTCKPCPIYNNRNPNAQHGKGQLDEHGTCRFRHVCNQWIKGHGPNAICGRAHSRRNCDHPDKCDSPEQ